MFNLSRREYNSLLILGYDVLKQTLLKEINWILVLMSYDYLLHRSKALEWKVFKGTKYRNIRMELTSPRLWRKSAHQNLKLRSITNEGCSKQFQEKFWKKDRITQKVVHMQSIELFLIFTALIFTLSLVINIYFSRITVSSRYTLPGVNNWCKR